MADLQTKYVGLTLTSPLVVASAGITETVERMAKCEENGAGAVVMKSYFEQEVCRQAPTPRFRVIEHNLKERKSFTFFSYEQASEWDIERYAQEVAEAKRQLKSIKVLPSLNCITETGWADGARLLEQAGADAIELNTSCPHGSITFRGGAVEETIARTVEAVRKAVSLPLVAKISPMLTSPLVLVKMLEEIGVNGVTIFNRFTGLDIDVDTQAPILHGGYAGHGGPWAIMYPLRWITQMRPQVNVDIAGSGGVAGWEDVVKYLLAGANVVQTCTSVYFHGYGILREFVDGLAAYMDRKGYRTIDEFRGKVPPQIIGTEEVDRRKKVRARIDTEWDAPCKYACPAGVPAQSYVRLAAEGNFADAVAMVRSKNPFQSICGRACYHPCEDACTRNKLGGAIAIRGIKRFLCDWGRKNAPLAQTKPARAAAGGRKVAIVGAGPAGLTAAHDLALRGHEVTVYESAPVAGGMMRLAIPEYRLPHDLVDEEIDYIRSLGVTIRTSTAIGRDVSLDELRSGADAVLLAVGAHKSIAARLPGENAAGVVPALAFLRRLNLGEPMPVSGRVIILGGGNSAIDAARGALRLGADEVYMVYRRTRMEMPAHPNEIAEAEEEGVRILYLATPVAIVARDGRATGLKLRSGYLGDLGGDARRRPVAMEEAEFVLRADMIITALGQTPDTAGFAGVEGLTLTRDGVVPADPDTRQSTVAGLFAAGDAAGRPASIIEAIADGKRAALYIDAYLRGEDLATVGELAPRGKQVDADAVIRRSVDAVPEARVAPELAPPSQRRRDFRAVELPMTAEAVRREAERCLACGCGVGCQLCQRICVYSAILTEGDKVQVDPMKCDGCGMCMERCPNQVIEMVAVEKEA